MVLFYPILLSTLAGLSTVLGALVIFLKIKNTDKFLTFSISLSLAIMISISLLELIPQSLPFIRSFEYIRGLILFFSIFGTGFILVKVLSNLTSKSDSLYRVGVLSFIVLIIHNMPEGVLTFLSSYSNFRLGLTLSIAIALHNIPEGISIAVPIYYATKNRQKALKYAILSGLAEPIGGIIGYSLFKNIISENLICIILLFVASFMITLSIEELFPKALEYKQNKILILSIIIGVLLSIVVTFTI